MAGDPGFSILGTGWPLVLENENSPIPIDISLRPVTFQPIVELCFTCLKGRTELFGMDFAGRAVGRSWRAERIYAGDP